MRRPTATANLILSAGVSAGVSALVLVATGGSAVQATAPGTASQPQASAVLRTANGAQVGTVTLRAIPKGTEVVAHITGQRTGFHGFHIHEVGRCEPNSRDPKTSQVGDFLSAGGHVGEGQAVHGAHAGDLTSFQVTASGAGQLVTASSSFTPAELLAGDGAAVMFHAGPDNFANIPLRYAPGGPDQVTRDTGDSGGRLACGVLTAAPSASA